MKFTPVPRGHVIPLQCITMTGHNVPEAEQRLGAFIEVVRVVVERVRRVADNFSLESS